MDKKIMELRWLVERLSKETREDFSGNLSKYLQHLIWRLGENHVIVGEWQKEQQQKGREENGKLWVKVWDPGGSQQQ
jgi:hypothetical protein